MKLKTSQILEEIAEDFNQFLKNGKFYNLTPFSKRIDPNLNIDNIAKLLKIHFVLTEKKDENEVGVIDYIQQLSKRIRRIKTSLEFNAELLDGKIKGKINNKKTIEQRIIRYPLGKVFFVCDKREKKYSTPENLILKKLLQIIHQIIHNDLKKAFENNYKWLKSWVKEEKLKMLLNQLFSKNIYLKRIDLTHVKITSNMINRVKKSRNKLYSEAAILLSKYQSLMNFELNKEEAKTILYNTFIIPEKKEVLFELYWIIKLLKQLRYKYKDIKYQLLEFDDNLIAKWELNGYTYKIYHDFISNFKFQENIPELIKKFKDEDNFVGRELRVLEKLGKLTSNMSKIFWDRRPDIILEKYDENGKLKLLFLGEIRYTSHKDYALSGLKELLEFMALIKEKGEDKYIETYDKKIEEFQTVLGVLFTKKIEDFGIQTSDDESVRVIMFGENDKLEKLLERIVS